MNIGISTSVIQRGRSGVAQYVLALVRAFLPFAERHRFTLFVLEDDLPLFAYAEREMKIVPVSERFRPQVKNIFWHQSRLPCLARQHRLNVLHLPSQSRMLWRRPCALVATVHDLARFRLTKKNDWHRMAYRRVVARGLAHRQDEIIAVSQHTARDILEFLHFPAGRLTMIYNGLDHARFFPGPREEAKTVVTRKHELRQPFFLYVARLEHPANNHARLIEAFNLFKAATRSDWRLVLGGSDWHDAEVIHALVRQSPFRRDIRCLGFVPDGDLPTWYRAAEVLVYPSLFDGFGLQPLEAMACGCPVISSARGSLGETVGDAAVIIDPEDISSLKQEMIRLAADEAARDHWREAGLRRAQCFNWDKTAAATINVLARTSVPRVRP
jgi:glycosyltransferase involved in cell wall biosynthesis